MQELGAKNHDWAVSHYDFTSLFTEAWYKSMNIKHILSGFKVCGIYPFNCDAIKLPQEQDDSSSCGTEDLPKMSGTKFIPMYSPYPSSRSKLALRNSTPNSNRITDCCLENYLSCKRLSHSCSDLSLHKTPSVTIIYVILLTLSRIPDVILLKAKVSVYNL